LKRRVGSLQEGTRQRQGQIAGGITDILTGIRDLRLGGKINGQVERLSEQFGERRQTQARQQMYTDLLTGLFRNIVTFGTAIVLIVISARLVSGDFRVGTLALFLTYTSWLGEQIFFFGRALARYQNAKVSHDRLGELVSGDAEALAPAYVDDPLRELQVTGLAWQPSGGSPGTAPISFTARPGQLVVLTGRIGAGKSSLVKGLLGLQGDVTGSIRWNDREVLGDTGWWRSPRVGYARQNAAFVTGTVRDNLLLGDDDAEERLAPALQAVGLDAGSHELPDGLDTEVGSGSAGRLSGGQRQRLAIARMLCGPAEVYVVDDADSSLDPQTARTLWETLPRQWPAIWIVVSHNPHAARNADRVVQVTAAGSAG
jgi:ATP-binding cassette subfamily B protein